MSSNFKTLFPAEEMKDGEEFIGNSNVSEGLPFPRKEFAHLKTMRLGSQAYCINGLPIPQDYCRPIFIHKSEMQAYDNAYKALIDKIRGGR